MPTWSRCRTRTLAYPEVCDFWRPSRETVEWLVILAMFCRRLVRGNNLSACLSSRHAYVQQTVRRMLHKLKFVTLEAEGRGCDSCLPACLPAFCTVPSRVPTSAAVFSVAVELLNL